MTMEISEWWAMAGLAVAPFLLPNSTVERAFYVIGRAMSVVLRQKAGAAAEERIEGYITGTVSAATRGLIEGMRD